MTPTAARFLSSRTGRRLSLSSLRASPATAASHITRRWKTKHSFSSYEYPLATQAPAITKTTVEQVAEIGKHPKNEVLDKKFPPPHQEDVFDDSHSLSGLEMDSIRTLQKEYISTNLQGSTAIEAAMPNHIPPNVPSESLQVPTTLLSTLDNGVRVVSQETYGQVCTIGVLINAGSRHETVTGTCHLLEMLAFHSTASHDSVLDVSKQLQDWGATSFGNTGREQLLYCLDILRPNVHEGMHLLSQVVLQPNITDEEVYGCKRAMEFQAHEIMPEILLGEVLQQAAYGGPAQQLGKRHFCPLEGLPELNADVVKSFCQAHVIHNPQGLVVAGAGIGHDELTEMASHYFGHLEQHNLPENERSIPSVYHGGRATLQHQTMDGFTRLALAFELGGWHSDDLVPTCVLQTLLGGGNSFSAGGPGKGMYSRLYRQVLNRYYWAESAEAFTSFHNESGLFGISGSSDPNKTRDMAYVLTEHFNVLSSELVSDEEFERACNMLKNNVLSQLESRLVLFEDMGRQVLTYGHREDTDTMCRKIDAVTKEDLRELVRKAMQQQPTLAAVGDDVSHVPPLEEVKSWLK